MMARADQSYNRDESEEERLDRNLLELLNELRVALPGVQVLFAFLLTVPFSQRFATLTETQEDVYYIALLATGDLGPAADRAVCAPPHQLPPAGQGVHRVPREQARDRRASAFLAIAMSCVVWLITDLLYGSTATAIATSPPRSRSRCSGMWCRSCGGSGACATTYVSPAYQAPNESANSPSAGISTVR